MASTYRRLKQYGIPVWLSPNGYHYVTPAAIAESLGDQYKHFCDFFGVQTCPPEGSYADDVEAVLERMASGKLVAGGQRN